MCAAFLPGVCIYYLADFQFSNSQLSGIMSAHQALNLASDGHFMAQNRAHSLLDNQSHQMQANTHTAMGIITKSYWLTIKHAWSYPAADHRQPIPRYLNINTIEITHP